MRKILIKLKTKALWILASIFIVGGVFVLGLYIGYQNRPTVTKITNISGTAVPQNIDADFEAFWKVWQLIDKKNPNADEDTAQERVYGAIEGLVGSLNDPYSVFFPPEDTKDFEDTINGSFEGIGMEVGIKDKILTVIAPLKNTPSERAGIKAGDKILKINDKNTSDMTVDEAVGMIRGKKGTPVLLTLYREGTNKPLEISVVRDNISIPTLDSELRADGVFVISLYNFSASSGPLFETALREFAVSGSNKLIVDLRGNPGGYLDSAVDIASFFLPEGDVIVSEDFGKNGKTKIYRSKGYDLLDLNNLKVAVLVDKGSASASEIVAGALNQHDVGPLIGETTYGKGSVQEVIKVTKDTVVKLTVATWLTPDGTSISLKGLDPTFEVKITEKDIAKKVDPVMNRALEYLKTGK